MAAARKLLLERLRDAADVAGHAAQIAPLHRCEDVYQGLHVVVRDHGGLVDMVERRQISEDLGIGRGWCADGHVEQRFDGIHAVLRRLHGDVIADATLRIEPEGGSGLKAGAQGDQQVAGDIALAQADGLREGAVDIQMQRGRVVGLLHVDIDRAGDGANAVGELPRHFVIAELVAAGDLHVDGRGDTEVENLGDDVGRLKEELSGWEAAG